MITTPTTRAAVLHGQGDLRVEETPTGPVGPGQARVRVEVVGVCGSDTHYLQHGSIGEFVLTSPIVLGHEPAGVVVEVGEGVAGLAVGDRVSVEPGTPCGVCAWCESGDYNLCPDMAFMATPPYDGAFAREIVWAAALLHRLPDELTLEQGALCEPLSVGIWASRSADIGEQDDVLVSGAGPVGLLAAQVARARGARVVVRDIDRGRLSLAEALGLDIEVVREGGTITQPDSSVLLECSGAPGALAAGMRRLRPRGRAVMIGLPVDEPVVPLAQLHHRELQVRTIFRYAGTWPEAIDLLQRGVVDTTGIVTHRFGLEDAEAALLAARTVSGCVKAVVLPQHDVVRGAGCSDAA